MTAAADIDRVIAEAAREREQLLAVLRQADAARAAAGRAARWTVVRQYSQGGEIVEQVVSSHRLELLAYVALIRLDHRHRRNLDAAHYTVRRADA